MIRPDIRRLEWLAGAALFAGTLFLASWVDRPAESIRESSLGARIAALVTCVVPAPAGESPAASTRESDAAAPDCETSTPDLLRTAWMTAC
jgi:hypothetical protein